MGVDDYLSQASPPDGRSTGSTGATLQQTSIAADGIDDHDRHRLGLGGVAACYAAEAHGNQALNALGLTGGNMGVSGKNTRRIKKLGSRELTSEALSQGLGSHYTCTIASMPERIEE